MVEYFYYAINIGDDPVIYLRFGLHTNHKIKINLEITRILQNIVYIIVSGLKPNRWWRIYILWFDYNRKTKKCTVDSVVNVNRFHLISVVYFTKEVDLNLAKQPLKFYGDSPRIV